MSEETNWEPWTDDQDRPFGVMELEDQTYTVTQTGNDTAVIGGGEEDVVFSPEDATEFGNFDDVLNRAWEILTGDNPEIFSLEELDGEV